MYNSIRGIKKEVRDFLLINFGLIAFISIFLFISATKPNNTMLLSSFGALFMYIPAFSAIVVLKKNINYKFTPTVDRFFKVFTVYTLIRIILSITEVLIIKNIYISSIMDLVVSGYLVGVVSNNKSDFEVFNLYLGKNFKKVLFVILLFLIIIIVSSIPDLISTKPKPADIINNLSKILFGIVINLILGFALFFGEEFGWRYFLQPRLQKIYGKKVGVIILGAIWGVWHWPLCMTLYSPKTPVYCMINHVTSCVALGVFLGYAYMKTENLWAPILIHLVNNCIGISISGGYETTFTLKILLVAILCDVIFFLPFLLTKEYRTSKTDEKVYLDN